MVLIILDYISYKCPDNVTFFVDDGRQGVLGRK
jgi:hypothetical protein